jgi:hypothetical protein
MIQVAFMRKDLGKKRGYAADQPTNKKFQYVDPFIIVQTDEANLSEDLIYDETVRLNLDKLMAEYPSTTEEYEDENGDTQTRTVHGYFHLEGRSDTENPPVITLSDILRG